MDTTTNITHAQLGEVLDKLHVGVTPSDLHGSLTGYLCAGASPGQSTRDWLSALELDYEPSGAVHVDTLDRLREQCASWLNDPELRFEPLLPAADAALDVRADALVQWCRGFLGGLGLGGAIASQELSADAREILQDFGAIAGSRFEYADREEDENALAEVIEFIRVGVLLLYTELAGSLPAGKRTVH